MTTALSGIEDLLDDARKAVISVAGVNPDAVYTYMTSLGQSGKDFLAKVGDGTGTRVHAWIIHPLATRPSEVVESCTRNVFHEIEILGWHSYGASDSAREERFRNIAELVLEELFKAASWPSRDYMEPDRWPEMEGPEVVRIGPQEARVLQVRITVYPAIAMAIQ